MVAYNDSAKGCAQKRSADQFQKSLRPNSAAVVTKDPIWT
jgi:hypothetical protein